MRQTPVESFFRSVFVFLLFIGASFGVAFAVSSYSTQQQAVAEQAAALRALVGE